MQGLLVGDLSDVQQLALLTVMQDDRIKEMELEHDRFRSMLVAVHPGEAKALLDVLDGTDEHADLAGELDDDALEDYEPFSHDEVSETIALMQRFGIAVS